MTQQDRGEVREMIHGILSGWEAATVAREDLIGVSLKNIEEHLGKINGKVSEHEKIININIPHSIDKCPQKDTIKEIRDNMITNKGVRTTIFTAIVGASALVTVIFIVIKLVTGNL
jgi:tetrahydromethanopterin S-methyltransferase subunit B